jgi:hypothetical protein
MRKFIDAHEDNIHGVLSSVDRIIFKGHSSLSWVKNMEDHLSRAGILIKDFKCYAMRLSQKLRVHWLIAKVPRSRRWRVTEKGWATMSAAVEIYEVGWMKMTEKKAA